MKFDFPVRTKIKVFKWFVLFLPSAKTIARQIYFYCWNEIAYFFVKADINFDRIVEYIDEVEGCDACEVDESTEAGEHNK